MENRSENRSTNCKNQTSNRTSSKTTNSATNEHKHPNQYTKGADDESAKNSTNSRSTNAKNNRCWRKRHLTDRRCQQAKPAAFHHWFPVRKAAGFRILISGQGQTAATAAQTAGARAPAVRSGTASPAGIRSR